MTKLERVEWICKWLVFHLSAIERIWWELEGRPLTDRNPYTLGPVDPSVDNGLLTKEHMREMQYERVEKPLVGVFLHLPDDLIALLYQRMSLVKALAWAYAAEHWCPEESPFSRPSFGQAHQA